MEKLCIRCGDIKPHSVRADGRSQSYCKVCTNAYSKAHYQANKDKDKPRRRANQQRQVQRARELLIELKNVPCGDCGQRFPACAMDFDHLDATTKLANVGNLVASGQRERLLAEAAKCEVVCANCHRIRTWVRRS